MLNRLQINPYWYDFHCINTHQINKAMDDSVSSANHINFNGCANGLNDERCSALPNIGMPLFLLANLPYLIWKTTLSGFIQPLQLSSVHVYLTYPFFLSWSLLEAMSAGCAIVASDKAPVREMIKHNETGLLVDFFDAQVIAEKVTALLGGQSERNRLGGQVRELISQKYDLASFSCAEVVDKQVY